MPYAQINYQQKLGTGDKAVSIHDAGCFLTAFCNLAERFGSPIDPPTLDNYFIQHNDFIREADGTDDLLSWGSITAYNPNFRVSSSGNGAPTDNNSIVKFIYNGGTTHFCLVVDAGAHLILDSWDGKVKNWSAYGNPVAYATYTNATPSATTSAKPLPVDTSDHELVTKEVPGYMTSNNAANHVNPVNTVPAKDYFVFNRANGMVNITNTPGIAGTWVNPADYETPAAPAAPPASAVTFQVGDIVTPTSTTDFNGTALDAKVLTREYPITELNGDRAVLGNGLNTAFHTGNLHLVQSVTAAPAPSLPQKPANIGFTKLDTPLTLIVNKNPTHKWDLGFSNDTPATSVEDIAQGTPFVAYGKAQRTDGDRPVYYMTEADFGQADATGIPTNNYGVNTVDLSPQPAPAATEAPAAGSGESEAVNVPVTVKSWQDSWDASVAGTYIATKDADIADLAGKLANVPLGHDQTVHVAGKVTKDGQDYYVTVKSHEAGNWYGVPASILVRKTTALPTQPRVLEDIKHPLATAHKALDSVDKIAADLNKDPEFAQFKQQLTPRGKIVADIAEVEEVVDGFFAKVNLFKKKNK